MPTLDQVLLQRARNLRDDVRRAGSGEQAINHVPTGFSAIDKTYGGIRIGCATELMAHTGDGKSAFARQVCEAAARSGVGVLWFCGEDPEDATAERYLADGTGITATEMGRLELNTDELARVDQAAEGARDWARRVDVRFGASDVEEVLAAVEGLTKVDGKPLRLVVLDYLQIFGATNSLESDIAHLATRLNAYSGDRRLASLLLSQVANDVLKRGRERYQNGQDISGFTPGLGDTEWCKRAEKSTKAVWSLVRPGRWRREMGEDAEDDYAELHVKKANFGPTGWEKIGWNGPATRFSNL